MLKGGGTSAQQTSGGILRGTATNYYARDTHRAEESPLPHDLWSHGCPPFSKGGENNAPQPNSPPLLKGGGTYAKQTSGGILRGTATDYPARDTHRAEESPLPPDLRSHVCPPFNKGGENYEASASGYRENAFSLIAVIISLALCQILR